MVPTLNLTFSEGTVRYIFSGNSNKQKKSKRDKSLNSVTTMICLMLNVLGSGGEKIGSVFLSAWECAAEVSMCD